VEHTVVYARVADHHLDEAIDVMSDMVYAPLFAEVDSEREVVLEEIAMYEDQPQELVHDLIAEAVFGHHPLGRPVIGTAEVISSVSRRAITAYHRSMYVPGNIVVAAAGYLDHNELLGLLERAESKVGETPARGRRVRSPLVKPPPPDCASCADTEQYHVVLAAPGIARDNERRYAVSLIDAILGGSASSRLFQEIREKRDGLCRLQFASQYTDTGQSAATRHAGGVSAPASRSRRARGNRLRQPRRTSSSGPRRT
jgi:predicted Zn-dependent peptidase